MPFSTSDTLRIRVDDKVLIHLISTFSDRSDLANNVNLFWQIQGYSRLKFISKCTSFPALIGQKDVRKVRY